MNIQWDAVTYTKNFDFVYQYGEDVLKLIDAKEGSLLIDLGCGNGALSEKLKSRGYRVIGIDASAEMIETAQKLHPDILFQKADAAVFRLDEQADAVFSNAVLHWIDADKQETVIKNITSQLKPGGQFVCEFGGKGCAEAVHAALERSFGRRGLPYPRTFYFPSIGEYTPILESCGLRVEYAVLFDRPTPQKGADGLKSWIRMFVKEAFAGIEENTKEEIIHEAVEELRPVLCKDGCWFVDYVRIRLKARKI